MSTSWSYDPEAGAGYLTLSHTTITRTTAVHDRVLVDFDVSGRPVGVEVLCVSTRTSEVPS